MVREGKSGQNKLWSDNINDDTTRPDHHGQNPRAELGLKKKITERKRLASNANGKPKVPPLLYRP